MPLIEETPPSTLTKRDILQTVKIAGASLGHVCAGLAAGTITIETFNETYGKCTTAINDAMAQYSTAPA